MKHSSANKFPPFSVLYNGGSEFLINKGFVVHAGNGSIIEVSNNGEVLDECWRDTGSKISLQSGQSIYIKVTHSSKTNTYRYSLVDLISAVTTTEDSDPTDTTTTIKIATVTYDEGDFNPVIDQIVNSDIYLSILGDGDI